MHYLITGHTGFKGSWLSLWLTLDGHQVSGIALDPWPGSLFDQADVGELLKYDVRADICDISNIHNAFELTQPDVVVHMAAQPLVLESYRDPRRTFETNVNGTLNVLEAASNTSTVRANLVVTTDKVYRNINQVSGYVESDPLGGNDPYSASKAMADILTQSWSKSASGPPVAIARAGNVIGGGDISSERLIPDIARAMHLGIPPVLRLPKAIRPWQHVLDCLNGYRLLVDHMLSADSGEGFMGAWNFGPEPINLVSVADVAEQFMKDRGRAPEWVLDSNPDASLREAAVLTLDSSKSRKQLQWRDRLSLEEAVAWTAQWYSSGLARHSIRDTTTAQIRAFAALG